MARALSVGEEAPNFDLTSTEDVLLMLRDEVPRTAVLLYFFGAAGSERARRDLAALAGERAALAGKQAVVRGISAAKLDELKELQRDLKLPFPLLHDDRGFAALYGVEAEEGAEVEPALVLVDRRQRVLWIDNPTADAAAGAQQALAALGRLPSPTAAYPGSVVNRLVDWWVHRFRKPRAA